VKYAREDGLPAAGCMVCERVGWDTVWVFITYVYHSTKERMNRLPPPILQSFYLEVTTCQCLPAFFGKASSVGPRSRCTTTKLVVVAGSPVSFPSAPIPYFLAPRPVLHTLLSFPRGLLLFLHSPYGFERSLGLQRTFR
jgi:hypothetical protein